MQPMEAKEDVMALVRVSMVPWEGTLPEKAVFGREERRNAPLAQRFALSVSTQDSEDVEPWLEFVVPQGQVVHEAEPNEE